MRYLVLIGALLLTGCMNTTTGVAMDSRAQSVLISNPQLAQTLHLDFAKKVRVNDLLQAQVTIVSDCADTQNLQYRFYWYDENNLEVLPGDSPWRHVVLYGQDTITIQGMAPRADATQYRIYIRPLEQ
ncbi:hypothetical protein VST7929_01672 [Vibrio stylophorae]|uniref:DUF1425 domain-containing protein n=1 Tax=Vibrio stylophorae TaxID=659351 RepID=A0ABM8ZU00_9VIBR|nr:YcfL family protein [Vibrio stylophorae]CAH0533797.1 hypothetical protein VST7929_01672 [Vibrio stylophorae]